MVGVPWIWSLLAICLLVQSALGRPFWNAADYPAAGARPGLYKPPKAGEVADAALAETRGTGGGFVYLAHTTSPHKPAWVDELFMTLGRPCIFVNGQAPYVRHDLYVTLTQLLKRKDTQEALFGLEYIVFIDVDLVQPGHAEINGFEAFLMEWKPAVGLPFLEPIYGHAQWYSGRPAWPWAQWDDAMVAYHVLAAPKLFNIAASPGWAALGWAARWRHRVWALLLFPERVLLTPDVHLYRQPGGSYELPDAEILHKTYLELVTVAKESLERYFVDRGDTWKVTMLAIPHPLQPYSPVITNGLRGGMPIGCHKCICPSASRGVPELYATAKPTWSEVVTGDIIRLHGLAQKRLHYAFMESPYTGGGFADVAEQLASRAVLPIEASRRHHQADVEKARADFKTCMLPGKESRLEADDIPEAAMALRELPVRRRTHLYVVLMPGPSLRGTCWLELLRRTDCWLLVLTWKEPLRDPPEALRHERVTPAYFPRSNIQEAKLSQHWIALEIMLAQGWRFSYVVRVDADACLTWNSEMGADERAALEARHGSPFGAFHDFLERDRPPVAVVHNVVDASAFSGPFNRSTGPWDLGRPCVLAWDHRFHAVSAEALPFYAFDLALQPLNWNTADVSVFYRLNAAFAGRTLSYTEVEMDIRTLKSSSESYLKVLGDDPVLPTVVNSWERTWLPLAHRTALGLPRYLRHRALYGFWMEWEASDGASDCLPPLQPEGEEEGASHESLWTAVDGSSSKEVCHSQRHPHLRWHLRSGALVMVMMLEQLITSFLGRLRRVHHNDHEKIWHIAGWDYSGAELVAAMLRETALQLRVYELVCEDAFDDSAKAANHSQPLSLEVHAQLHRIADERRFHMDWFSYLRDLVDAARAFRMDGGRRADGLPPGGREPLLMHLQLRATLEALPAARIAHHDPRAKLPKPQRPQVFFAPPRLARNTASGSAGTAPGDEVEEVAGAGPCLRAKALPVENLAHSGTLCVGHAAPPDLLLPLLPPRPAASSQNGTQSLEAAPVEGTAATDGGGGGGSARRCSDFLVLPPDIPASASSPAAQAAGCFREMVQGFRYTAVLYADDDPDLATAEGFWF
mmetsp:Transcript_27102/g.90022  ORF Transcript_27102/g.90022 Transcript_27102/m.90022 type:complete len:1087 (+) Transcript_27102:54-3314(+)